MPRALQAGEVGQDRLPGPLGTVTKADAQNRGPTNRHQDTRIFIIETTKKGGPYLGNAPYYPSSVRGERSQTVQSREGPVHDRSSGFWAPA